MDAADSKNSVMVKILRMREEALFPWHHHVLEISGTEEALQHFMSKPVFLWNCDIICFSKKANHREYSEINNYSEGWKDIHETAGHSFGICHKEESVKILEEFYLLTVI